MKRAGEKFVLYAAVALGVYFGIRWFLSSIGERTRSAREQFAILAGRADPSWASSASDSELNSFNLRQLAHTGKPLGILAVTLGFMSGAMGVMVKAGASVALKGTVLGAISLVGYEVIRRMGALDAIMGWVGVEEEPCARQGGVEYELGIGGGPSLYRCNNEPWTHGPDGYRQESPAMFT